MPKTNRVLPPQARWRELRQPLDLQGRIWIDAATGVIIRTNIAGRFEVLDREVRPTQLTIRYNSEITQIGRVKPLKPPKHVDEFKRRVHPSDPLAFFRSELEGAPEPAARDAEQSDNDQERDLQ